MNFSSLSSAWLFALLVPLVVFYFLKLRRPRQVVPSLVLWRQVINDQRVNSPFQRFKRNILLLLQILLLALLVLAAMQPFLRRAPEVTSRLPILVDISASMAGKAGDQSRLDEAKKRIGERIESLVPGQEIALVAFSKSARRLTGFTDNKSDLRAALDGLKVEDTAGGVDEALRVAQAMARTQPFEKAVLISDGNLPGKSTFELPFQIEIEKLPPAGPNVGIVALNARRGDGLSWDVFVQLGASANHSVESVTVDLRSGADSLASESIAVGGDTSAPRLAFRIAGDTASTIRAVISTPRSDSLASDNEAWLTLPALRPLDVFAPESFGALRRALGTMEGLRIFPTKDSPSPASFDLLFAANSEELKTHARLSVGLGFVPEELRDTVAIGKGSIAAIDWRRDSPLLLHMSFDEVLFSDDPKIVEGVVASAIGARGYEVLVDGPHGPLMLGKMEEEAGRVYALFVPERSTLPFRVAFPVWVSNLVEQARRYSGTAEAGAVETGVLPRQIFSGAGEVTVEGPAGRRVERTSERGVLSGIPAPFVGDYRLSGPGGVVLLGASLLSLQETSLATIGELEFGDSVSVEVSEAGRKTDRSLWWSVAFLGYCVLLLEWWWFQRKPW
jgi:Ca-activated chloride channel homolog